MNSIRPIALVLLAAAALGLSSAAAAAAPEASFEQTAASAQDDLEQSLKELSELREKIAAEKLPLTRRLRELEARLIDLRGEHEEVARELDGRRLEMNNLRPEIEGREKEQTYLSNLLDEYARNFETRVHITELQRYREVIDRARLAPEDSELAPAEVYAAQAALVETSLDRLDELVGGALFEGTAVDSEHDGVVKDITLALVGPVALYHAEDGSSAGLAEQRLGSLEPNMIRFDDPDHSAQVRAIVATGSGRMPFDPSLGNALKIEATRDTLVEHVKKGGIVMVPILVLAGAALIVALLKWGQIARIPTPSRKRLDRVLEAVKLGDGAEARKRVRELRGPTGAMLTSGVENMGEPKQLVEELMFERMLETRLRLQGWLPFVAMTASAAPLLGLLGTVTGMINTFKLITVFGSGDAKTLSSGISEALITTQFGLIVAIPSLVLYAYLSRRARRMVDGMEKTAVAFLNRLNGNGRRPDAPGSPTEEEAETVGADRRAPSMEPSMARTGVSPVSDGQPA